MMHRLINLNCDVGEGIGNEEALMPYISSCSIACGGHVGDIETMKTMVRLAKRFKIKIGAHPSYPDKVNFGRKTMPMPPQQFIKSIKGQIQSLEDVLNQEKAELHHIKAHGALYNDIAKDTQLAQDFLRAIEGYKGKSALFVPYASVIEQEAICAGFQIKREAFGDRNYNRDLSLVPRQFANAVLEKPEDVLNHIVFMAHNGQVRTVEGVKVKILADTYCIHGDTASALEILTYLSIQLPKKQINIQK